MEKLGLKSRNVIPEQLSKNKFKFKYTALEHALKNLESPNS
ncbi:MAG: DUF1731 domain-containing protein [Flavobacteriaceae bacterium]|nr:DUF1731 domain-containing protein [Flavobacteriaceae bacterium]